MSDKKFLASVAEYYAQRATVDNLARYVFVMPNKRSGLFLKDHFKRALAGMTRPVMMPRFHTIQHVMADLSGMPAMQRNEQLFVLFDCYRRLLDEHRRPIDEHYGDGSQRRLDGEFDRFAFWGEIILKDFDDIDASLADASKLFANLRGVKELAADFLTDEQKEIVRNLWGDSEYTIGAAGRFWLHVPGIDEQAVTDSADSKATDNDSAASEGKSMKSEAMHQHFLHLWQILGPLYKEFHAALKSRKLTTEGGQQRRAAQLVRMGQIRHQPRIYVFTGLTEVTNAQYQVMRGLKDRSLAHFFWDYDMLSPQLRDSEALGIMVQRLRGLRRTFPSPDDYTPPRGGWPRDILCVGISSNIAQTRYMGHQLKQWYPDLSQLPVGADRSRLTAQRNRQLIDTAVVMPDDKLLLPAVMSLPPGVTSVNVTMRMPYMVTSFATLLSTIVALHMRAGKSSGDFNFFYEDIERILSHPLITAIVPDRCQAVLSSLREERKFRIMADDINARIPQLDFIFRPGVDQMSVHQVHAYVMGVLDGLEAAFHKLSDKVTHIEYEMLDYFRQQLDDLYRLVQAYDVQMHDSTYFILFERLLAVKLIDLHGSPLQGLQLMGVLETRTLDFKRLIIMSANERVLPRRNNLRTMIPTSLRQGFGMATPFSSDSEYTYHFYRMLSGADQVVITYDTRGASFNAGEMSRYLRQLRHMPGSNARFAQVMLVGGIDEPATITIDKRSPDVSAALDRYLTGGDKYLSASALKTYKACPMKFYYKYLCGIKEDEEINDFLTAADYGTVVHAVLQHLYQDFEGKLVNAQTLKQMRRDDSRIDSLIHQAIDNQVNPRPRVVVPQPVPTASLTQVKPLLREYNIVKRIITHFIKRTLEIESKHYSQSPFIHIGDEQEIRCDNWQVTDDLAIRFKMIIDRVDQNGDGSLRFIDYKTGRDSLTASNMPALFKLGKESYTRDAIFQLMLYCIAYADRFGFQHDIHPSIYLLSDMIAKGDIKPITIGTKQKQQPLLSFRQFEEPFRQEFAKMITELFDRDKPFQPNETDISCKFCKFLDLCGKTKPEEK